MKRREFLKEAGAVALPLMLSGGFLHSENIKKKKLNVVLILLDDYGWADSGCYGSTFYETPNIDRLAAEGMRFTDAYSTCPICSPSRGSILSGKYTPRTGLTDRIVPSYVYDRGKVIPAPTLDHLPTSEFIVPQAFKAGGYTTYMAGKWHVGGHYNERDEQQPQNRGFDIVPISFVGASYFYPYRNVSSEWLDSDADLHLTDRITDVHLNFLDEHAHDEKPFFMYAPYLDVHGPYAAEPGLEGKYAEKASKLEPTYPRFRPEGHGGFNRLVQDDPMMAGMIEKVDKNVGRILDKIKELGIEDNTAVVLASDNGGVAVFWPDRKYSAPTSNMPLRAGKAHVYEGGIREPLIIRMPGVTKPGSVCSDPVIYTDLYPTMLELAGLPLRPEQHVDGLSLVPLLKGAQTLGREALYWHYPHYDKLADKPSGAIRVGDYKLLEFFEDMHIELYNLKEDIGEQNNLVSKMPEKAAQLRKMLHEWRKSVGAKMPTWNPDYVPGAPARPTEEQNRQREEIMRRRREAQQ